MTTGEGQDVLMPESQDRPDTPRYSDVSDDENTETESEGELMPDRGIPLFPPGNAAAPGVRAFAQRAMGDLAVQYGRRYVDVAAVQGAFADLAEALRDTRAALDGVFFRLILLSGDFCPERRAATDGVAPRRADNGRARLTVCNPSWINWLFGIS